MMILVMTTFHSCHGDHLIIWGWMRILFMTTFDRWPGQGAQNGFQLRWKSLQNPQCPKGSHRISHTWQQEKSPLMGGVDSSYQGGINWVPLILDQNYFGDFSTLTCLQHDSVFSCQISNSSPSLFTFDKRYLSTFFISVHNLSSSWLYLAYIFAVLFFAMFSWCPLMTYEDANSVLRWWCLMGAIPGTCIKC